MTPIEQALREADTAVTGTVVAGPLTHITHSGNKYHRTIVSVDGTQSCVVDVYCVLVAFSTKNPGVQHAVKKLLCAGLRGKADTVTDLVEARDAISRAIQIEQGKVKS